MHKRVQTNGHMRMFTMLLSNWGHSRCNGYTVYYTVVLSPCTKPTHHTKLSAFLHKKKNHYFEPDLK